VLQRIPVGGRHHAHVEARLDAVGADALNLTGLEEPEQQRLHPWSHLAHFVEEHRALVRRLEQPHAVAMGAGEAAPDVAEQLRLEEGLWNADAVDGDERRLRASAEMVHEAARDFLADAALSRHQHLGVAAGRVLDLGANRPRGRTDSNELVHRVLHRITPSRIARFVLLLLVLGAKSEYRVATGLRMPRRSDPTETKVAGTRHPIN
jgi:hypothetical protein